jgi:hypothetical protein
MKRITCPHCRRTFSEADEGWDRSAATGACPNCGRMLDAAQEQHALMDSLDPQVVKHSRSVRLTSLILGVCSLPAGILLGFFHIRYVSALVSTFAMSQLGMAVFFTPRVAARRRLRRQTDITRFATESAKKLER